jgi:hypothetical protein
MVPLVLVLAAVLLGLQTGERTGQTQPPAEAGHEVTLYVSNQSFDRSLVDIRIEIDGREVVHDDFAVENQHNWVEYPLRLETGRHTLLARTEQGDAVLNERFMVRGRTWMVVDFWCCGEPADPRFTFYLSHRPIGFA